MSYTWLTLFSLLISVCFFCIYDKKMQRKQKNEECVLVCRLLLTHRSPGLNSRENLVLFFLCFLLRLRIESGMLFLRFVPRPPLWEEAVELADDVSELQSGYSHKLFQMWQRVNLFISHFLTWLSIVRPLNDGLWHFLQVYFCGTMPHISVNMIKNN